MTVQASLKVEIEPLEDAHVLRVAGDLDLNTLGELKQHLEVARLERTTTLVDMSGVAFIDSAGLDLLLDAARAANDEHWAWFLVRPSEAVLILLDLTGTTSQLPVVAPASRDVLPRVSRAPSVNGVPRSQDDPR